MALSSPAEVSVLTRDETNFLRLAHLIIRISPSAVRTLFDKYFSPLGLQNYLNQIKEKLESLYQRRVINQSQMDLLFPTIGTRVTSSDMDATLMLVLIRNFTKLKIKDTLPLAADVSEGDDLSRIRHYRNIIAHSADGRINNAEFLSAWKEISEAIQRIGGVSFKGECDSLLTAELDNSYRDVYLDFVRTQKRLQEVEDDVKQLKFQHNDPVPSNIKELMLSEIFTWKSDDDKFFSTSAAKNILSLVHRNSFVVITGSPGMGKSVTARHIALTLKTTKAFDILPVAYPKDIVKYFNNGCKQIFLLDDICGKFTADKTLMREWERHQETLQKLFEKNTDSFRVLGTCRLQVSKIETFQKLSKALEIKECNLLSKDLTLSTNEKRGIASKHFDTEIVTRLSDETINEFDMFPLLCSLFAKSDYTKLDIFENPFQELERELDKFRDNNEGCFVGLALLVINNNKLNKNIFNDRTNQLLDQIFDDLVEICRLTKRPVKHHVMAMLRTLNETYVTESDTCFNAVHDKIFDMISFYFGKSMIEIILKYGKNNLIFQRFELESLNIPHDEYTIMISQNIEDLYFRRMLQEIEHRKLFSVFDNRQMELQIFQQKFVSYLSKHSNLSSIFLHNQWSIILSELSDTKLILDYLINELDQETDSSENSLEEYIDLSDYEDDLFWCKVTNAPLIFASFKGLIKSTRILLNHGVDSNGLGIYDGISASPLASACKTGQAGIVSMLTEHNCDLNLMCNGTSALHIACKKEYGNIVDILLKANCDVNIQDLDQNTPLLIACETENLNIVTMLLKSNCKVNVPNAEGKTPLHAACFLGFEEIVQLLLSKHCDLDTCDNFGNTALAVCCSLGHFFIAERLIKNNCDYKTVNYEGRSPLEIALDAGHEQIVNLLLNAEEKTDIA